jgi:hypothetical protein
MTANIQYQANTANFKLKVENKIGQISFDLKRNIVKIEENYQRIKKPENCCCCFSPSEESLEAFYKASDAEVMKTGKLKYKSAIQTCDKIALLNEEVDENGNTLTGGQQHAIDAISIGIQKTVLATFEDIGKSRDACFYIKNRNEMIQIMTTLKEESIQKYGVLNQDGKMAIDEFKVPKKEKKADVSCCGPKPKEYILPKLIEPYPISETIDEEKMPDIISYKKYNFDSAKIDLKDVPTTNPVDHKSIVVGMPLTQV